MHTCSKCNAPLPHVAVLVVEGQALCANCVAALPPRETPPGAGVFVSLEELARLEDGDGPGPAGPAAVLIH